MLNTRHKYQHMCLIVVNTHNDFYFSSMIEFGNITGTSFIVFHIKEKKVSFRVLVSVGFLPDIYLP